MLRSQAMPRSILPLGLLGMLILVVGVELTLSKLGSFISNPIGLEWRFGALAARRKAKHYEILSIGDSLLRFGIVPEVLTDRLDSPAFNLAIDSATPAVTFFQLRRAFESGARPKALIVDFVPHLLDWEPQFGVQLLPEIASLRDCIDLAWACRDASLLGHLMLGRWLPSMRDRHGIRARILGFVSGEDGVRLLKRAGNLRNWRIDHRGRANPGLPAGTDMMTTALFPFSWRCAPLNARYVERALALAEARAVPTFLVVPPFRPSVHERREQLGLDQGYTVFLKALQHRHPQLWIIDARRAGFADAEYLDPLHLNRPGARRFTAQVAELLRVSLANRQPSDRWLELTPSAEDDVMTDD